MKFDIPSIRSKLINASYFDQDILNIITHKNWLNIWVPKCYRGLGLQFSDGLEVLQSVARIDGSLGWFVTLCSGANYFSRNLKPEIARKVFSSYNVCFGGSGMLGGTAEKIGENYIINGLWNYATGAPYLTHFTLNARLIENGTQIVNEKGGPLFRSFVLEKSKVISIPTWNSMGMVATSSQSFKVINQAIHQDYSFTYDYFYSTDLVEKIPFRIFADLTLLVNYLGMAEHFLEKSVEFYESYMLKEFEQFLKWSTIQVITYAKQIEKILKSNKNVEDFLEKKIHFFGEETIKELTRYIISLYPHLGIKASKINEELNQIFRDYFTATQHRNFRKEIF